MQKYMSSKQFLTYGRGVDQVWFSKGSMEFFNTQIFGSAHLADSCVWIFVTTDSYDENASVKSYTVRYLDPEAKKAGTIGPFNSLSLEEAEALFWEAKKQRTKEDLDIFGREERWKYLLAK